MSPETPPDRNASETASDSPARTDPSDPSAPQDSSAAIR